jgi:uncharacterized heparinase superfamily protein
MKKVLPADLLARDPPNVEKVLVREFMILGKTLKFKEIDWEADFSGGSWPKLPAAKYASFYVNDFSTDAYKIHGDVKRAWEFNKHLHFVDIASSYSHSKDPRLDHELCLQLRDWIEKHPYPVGIGWAEPLIVSQRAISWIIVYNLGCLSTETKRLSASLFIHGYDIAKRLEICASGWNSNHLIGELAALHLIGKTVGAEGWERLAMDLLEKELRRQVLDYVHYEQSSSYHRYVLEFISLVWLANGRGPKWLTDKISRMTSYLKTIASSDNTLPLLSDQDGARVWVRNIYKPLELFDLVETGSSAVSRAFHDSGYYVMRYDSHVLIFDCGPIGMKGMQLSTHGHSDLLSFVLSVSGKPFVVDIGSGTYTEDKSLHDYFRSTAGHNTVTVDGKDQCGLSRTWTVDRHPHYWLIDWRKSNDEDIVAGGHDGFHPLTHERKIVMRKLREPEIQIRDRLTGTGMHEMVARLHLHPDVEIRAEDATRVELSHGGVALDIEITECFPCPALSIREGLYSPDYGQIQKTKVIEVTAKQECPIEFSMRLNEKRI